MHTINLITKSILKPFDIWKTKGTQEFDDVAQALVKEQDEATSDKDKKDKECDDGEDNARLWPIRSMLLKVHLHSTDPNPRLGWWMAKLQKLAFMLNVKVQGPLKVQCAQGDFGGKWTMKESSNKVELDWREKGKWMGKWTGEVSRHLDWKPSQA